MSTASSTWSVAAGDGLTAYYPSTVFVDDGPPDLVEYAAAKAAGEVAARRWADAGKQQRLVIDRLPRLATDQTAALRPLDLDDPVPLLLDAIRRTVGAVTWAQALRACSLLLSPPRTPSSTACACWSTSRVNSCWA